MIELEELYKKDIYAQTYGKLFTDRIEDLADVIVNQNTKSTEFTVFALESGLGKSKYTNKIIDENLSDWGKSRKYLVIKRFKEDVEDMENSLSHHNVPERIETPAVLGITSKNWHKWREQTEILKKINVIIITHQRYINLCLDDELRSAFSQEREVLIIDEKINFPIYSFSDMYYARVREALPSIGIGEAFDKVCKKLRKTLEKRKIEGDSNKCVRVEPNIHPATIKNFQDLMEINIKDIKDSNQRNIVKEFMDGLEHWYNEMCIYNGGNIITFNRKHKLWGLKNNIILDASSTIDGVYQISENYRVKGEIRIIDHSKSKFHSIPFNTSKSNLNDNQIEFFKEIAEKIKQHHKENEQTLIICHKDNFPKIEKELLRLGITDIHIAKETIRDDDEEHAVGRVTQLYAINWFGNVIGKNEYADFTNCWIIGTPNLRYGQYLMHYMMYANQKNLGNKNIDIVKGNFKNNEFNELRTGYVASDIYQSLKRIQRNVKPNGNFFIVNSNQNIIDLVLGQIKGTDNREEIQLDFVLKQKYEQGSNNLDILIDYMKEKVFVGEHRKKDICEVLNITNLSRLLKTERFKALVEHGYIKINRTTIEKLKEWKK